MQVNEKKNFVNSQTGEGIIEQLIHKIYQLHC